MHEIHDLKEMLMDEATELAKKGELTPGSLDTIDKLLNSIKNACKIIMFEEYEDSGNSYDDGMGISNRSYSRAARRRDSMGRYSRSDRRGGYSYDDGAEAKIQALREAMQEAESDQERMLLKKMIRRIEQG